MQLDVEDLRDFYHRPIGQVARRLLAHRIRARWRRTDGETVIGLGYAAPYLGAYRNEAHTIGALMPVAQGAVVWPARGPKLSVLVDEHQLPLPDNSADKILLVHCLEVVERVAPLLRELWRVLKPEGRLLMIVPNRRGLWARRDATPFGYGRPYSAGQIDRLLRDAMFSPVDCAFALHAPPVENGWVLRSALAWERLGARMWNGFGGVMLVEANKEVMSPLPTSAKARRAAGRLVAVRGGNAFGQHRRAPSTTDRVAATERQIVTAP